jgi:DNA invertase Pin-like site-specific DNA recombinase
MPKAIIFARVSSREQEETGYSLDSQVKLLQDYAERHGFEVAKTWKISESASGKQIRKSFNEVLRYVSQHGIPIILCEKIDRLTRNLKDASVVDEWVKENSRREVHFVKESFVLNGGTKAHENLVWDMKVAIARFYTNNLSEEVRKGQKEKLAQGWIPMRAKLGYKTIGEKGHKTHILDEAVAPLVRRMFELYSSGNYSLKALVDAMAKMGLRNEYGRKIGKSRIHELLSDPFYCGQMVWLGQVYEGHHETLVTKELFGVVQEKLERKIKNPQYKKHLPVFKGKIDCEECGGTIRWYTAKGHWYGECNHYKGCSQKGTTRQEKVEDQLIPLLNEAAPKSKRALQWLEKALKEGHAQEIKINTSKRDELTRIVRTADKRMEQAYRDKLDNKMPIALCEKIINESTQEKKDALDALNKLTESRQAYYEAGYAIHELARNAEAIYRSPKATVEQRRLLLSYGFSNLGLNAGKISHKYTPAFQFLTEWMPKVNKIFEPQKAPTKSELSALSDEVSALR